MLVGLTGGAGCGKTTVLRIFGELGWFTVDADSLVHEIYREGTLTDLFRERWGEGAVTDSTGNIDRRKIAAIVFNDGKELEWIESVLHPAVFLKAEETIKNCGKSHVIFDVPLLYEKNKASIFDLVISVWTEKQEQYRRLSERNWSINDIESRNSRQLPQCEKLEQADFGIINTGSMSLLREQCEILDKQIRTIQYGKKKNPARRP